MGGIWIGTRVRRTRWIPPLNPAPTHHDRHRIVIDENFLAEYTLVAGEACHPVVVAERDDRMALVELVVFLGIEHAPDGRLYSQRAKIVARHHFR